MIDSAVGKVARVLVNWDVLLSLALKMHLAIFWSVKVPNVQVTDEQLLFFLTFESSSGHYFGK